MDGNAQVKVDEQMQIWLCEWYPHCDGGHHEM